MVNSHSMLMFATNGVYSYGMQIRSTYVNKIYPLMIGKMLQTGGKKSIDMYINPRRMKKLKELMSKISEDKILHFILIDVSEGRSTKRFQMMVEECDRIPDESQ
jgi:hypothetical protein